MDLDHCGVIWSRRHAVVGILCPGSARDDRSAFVDTLLVSTVSTTKDEVAAAVMVEAAHAEQHRSGIAAMRNSHDEHEPELLD